jgi:hypothetical protein
MQWTRDLINTVFAVGNRGKRSTEIFQSTACQNYCWFVAYPVYPEEDVMERLHLRPLPDTRTGRDCQFCQHDPEFENRNPIDRLVSSKQNDTAAVHMTENGYVLHRMLELQARLAA